MNNRTMSATDAGGDAMDLMPSLINIDSSGNHIYFYEDVNALTILKLNKLIRDLSTALEIQAKNGLESPCLYIHINSGGGSIFDAFAAVDTIKASPVTVITIVEGYAASAATLISIAGDMRFIHNHSHMLIHQLSSSFWGKHNEFQDEMQNLNALMKIIKEFYGKNTLIPIKNIDEILKHDIYLSSGQCVALGLVDGIIGGVKDAKRKPVPAKKATARKKAAGKAKPKTSKSKSGGSNSSGDNNDKPIAVPNNKPKK